MILVLSVVCVSMHVEYYFILFSATLARIRSNYAGFLLTVNVL